MDYTKASKFEINKAVAIKSGRIPINKSSKYFLNYCPDYCNDPAAMWPIIQENDISLIKDVSTYDSWLAIPRGWFSVRGFESSMGNELSCVNTNPLRAAAIVYLMLEE